MFFLLLRKYYDIPWSTLEYHLNTVLIRKYHDLTIIVPTKSFFYRYYFLIIGHIHRPNQIVDYNSFLLYFSLKKQCLLLSSWFQLEKPQVCFPRLWCGCDAVHICIICLINATMPRLTPGNLCSRLCGWIIFSLRCRGYRCCIHHAALAVSCQSVRVKRAAALTCEHECQKQPWGVTVHFPRSAQLHMLLLTDWITLSGGCCPWHVARHARAAYV